MTTVKKGMHKAKKKNNNMKNIKHGSGGVKMKWCQKALELKRSPT